MLLWILLRVNEVILFSCITVKIMIIMLHKADVLELLDGLKIINIWH